ncbi:DUF7147 family protein [Peribacillus kribbensis]|uniref:DUF7147 family protein n=1 Tax=Peribacillus kribbensis TaxID=356658 RepID=UPI00040FCB89|nr:hypothetical protein [Peribacillus kribbensis]
MIQRFIELGEGYSDLYELLSLGKSAGNRTRRLFALHTIKNNKPATSLAISMEPTHPGDFLPIYICREGIPNPHHTPNKRYELFKDLADSLEKQIIELEVKPSSDFAEKELYFQYLIGIMRMNKYLPPLQ